MELKSHRPTVLAVDFDGTLCSHQYPRIGAPNYKVIEFLRNWKSQGNQIILWTCRNGKELLEAIEWMKKMGIEPDVVNDDTLYTKNTDFGKTKSHKVCADYYLDDRNITIEEVEGIIKEQVIE